jgi:PKD repeat protein
MKARLFIVFTIVASLALALVLVWAVAAQGPEPPQPTPAWDWDGGKPLPQPVAPTDVDAQAVSSTVPLGQPGLSFRYLRTFGETEVPYFDDADRLFQPLGVGIDGSNVWIVEEWIGRRALKYASDGTFLMKIGRAGLRDVAGTTFDRLADVAVDGSGSIWVVDQGAHHVVKFNSSGSRVSELGLTWNPGTGNDRFNNPYSIAFDSVGNIYISDSGNHRIQVFNNSGVYSTTIGMTGVSGADNAHFNSPKHITVDSNNRLYVADGNNHRVQVFDVSNLSAITYVATIGVSGEFGSDNSHFNSPEGVAIDVTRGRIYVADVFNWRVQVFDYTTRGYLRTLTGFGYIADVAVDSTGNLYVAEPWDSWCRVQQLDSNLNYVRTYGTTGVPYLTNGSHYNFPMGLAVAPDGSIYIGEWDGRRVTKLNAAGVPQWIVGEAGVWGSDNEHFSVVGDVALDAAGRVYVDDVNNCRIQIYNPDGSYYATLGTGCGSGDYQFNNPWGLTIAPNGDIYVADWRNHRVQIFNSDRVYLATLGVTGVPTSTNAGFNEPLGVAVDSRGTIYVSDHLNCRVQVFNSSRAYVRTIGMTGVCGSEFDRLAGPAHLFVDDHDNLFIDDRWNSRVQVFDSSGAYLTTVGGSSGSRTGQMREPNGLALDATGNLYVADSGNSRVQKFAPGVPGWVQSNINGFGDRRNNDILTLAPFGGQLYAGTYNGSGNGAQLWRLDSIGWTSVITNGFGNSNNGGIDHLLEFDGQLYASTYNEVDGGEVWRSSNGLNWSRVARQGFGVPTNGEIFRFAVFSDTLYASTLSYTTAHGAEIWRSSTGVSGDWTRVVTNGFGDANNSGIFSFEVFNSYLYAGTYKSTGGEVWRTNDGTTWTRVNTDGFGDTGNCYVPALAAFNSYLYASTYHRSGAGAQVWRCQVCDGSDWQKMVDNGFGNVNTRGMNALEIFGSRLYFVAGNSITGMEAWRTVNGTNWEQVGSAGFGDSNNYAPYWDNSVTVFNNRLFLGTSNSANGGEVWRKTVVTADFTASPASGPSPLMVTFTNTSTGEYITSRWDFGDGITSTLTSPTHTYTAAGIYTVTLTVGDGVDSNTVTRTSYITVYTPVSADFTASPTSGIAPLTVVFTNTSTGDYTTSLWDFGDSITSTLTSPTHTYTAVGVYTVTLTVSGPGGSDTEAKAGYITVRYSVYLPLIMRKYNYQ